MKIESFVEEILELLSTCQDDDDDLDFEELHAYENEINDTVEKLNKMQQLQGKDKKKNIYLNYWKVSQALAEMGLQRILDYIENGDREIGFSLLVHCTNNSASLRRLRSKREYFYENLFDTIHYERESHIVICDETNMREDVLHCLIVAYRLLLMGSEADVEELLKWRGARPSHTILGEVICTIQEISTGFILADDLKDELPVEILVYCMKILQFISEVGTSSAIERLAVFDSASHHVCDQLCDYLNPKNKHSNVQMISYPKLKEFVKLAKEYKKVMRSLPDPRYPKGFVTKSKCERLALMEFNGDYFVFCSSPECRKVAYADKKFRHCAKCMLARYCSNQCQVYHWANGHKNLCKSSESVDKGKKKKVPTATLR